MRYLSFAIFLLFISSCSKYEENEGLTLKSKTKRLVGTWDLIEVNEIESTSILDSVGYFKLSSYYAPVDIYVYETYLNKENNTWEFEGDFEVKQKSNVTTYKLNYGLTSSLKALTYDTLGPIQELNIKKWAFSNGKRELKIKTNASSIEYNILQLTNDALKLEDDFGNTMYFEKNS